jgi:hypothetical protein
VLAKLDKRCLYHSSLSISQLPPGVPAFNLDDKFLLKRERQCSLLIPFVASFFRYSCSAFTALAYRLAEMEQEHCVMTGCNAHFECSLHYESKDGTSKPTTTAKQEWDYVVNFKQDAPPSYLEGFKLKKMYKERKADRYVDPEDKLGHGLSDAERLGLALYTGPMVRHLAA